MQRDNTMNNWSLQETWNNLIVEERIPEPRTYIRASELGKPFLDRYYTMKGEKPTNPFSARILRVFDSGKIFEVQVIERIFRLLGILIKSQGEVTLQIPGLLPVIGHHDPKVGGKIDIAKVEKILSAEFFETMFKEVTALNPLYAEFLELARIDDWMRIRIKKLVEKLLADYPNGLRVLTTEIKTVNSHAFWSPANKDDKTAFFGGYPHHKLQLWTYLMADEQPEGRLFYISKDDLTLMESPVFFDDEALKDLWMKDVTEMTRLWNLGVPPDKEEDIVFNNERNCYEPNWRIKRSSYFTKITGFTTTEDWERTLRSELKKLNDKPCKTCEQMFSIATLKKNNGFCARCAKKLQIIKDKGGEI